MIHAPSRHLSTLAIERLAADDVVGLPTPIISHFDRCRACQDRVAQRTVEHARFAEEVDVSARVDQILRAAKLGTRPRRRTWIAATGAVFAAAAVVLLVVSRAPEQALDGRRKGTGGTLEVLRRTHDGHGELVAWGDALHPGDAIRFRVTLPSAGYVGVLGIDAAQAVTAYAPAGATLERVAGGAPALLDGGIVLDDTLGAERIVMVVCDWPRPVADAIGEARAALARAGGDPAQMGAATTCNETATLIWKVAR